MKALKKLIVVTAVAMSTGIFGIAAPARAEIPIVDGKIWAASSVDEKRAYLVGIANTVAVNEALQAKRGTVDNNAPNNRIASAFDMTSIDQAIAKIDQWYAANPSRRNAPVLGVIWLGLVKAGR